MSTRKEQMQSYAAQAKEADRRGDVVIRQQAAQTWRELATNSEADRAPRYLTWIGRKYNDNHPH